MSHAQHSIRHRSHARTRNGRRVEPHYDQLRLPVDRDLRDFFCGLPEYDEWLRTRWSGQGIGQRLEAAFCAIATFAIDIRRMNVAGDIGAHWFHDVRNEHSRVNKDSAKFQCDPNLMVHRPGQIDRHQNTADSLADIVWGYGTRIARRRHKDRHGGRP